MTIEPGQVYLVDLGMAAKTRPMLVMSRHDEDAPRALAVCAPITTSTRNSEYEVSIGKPKFLHEPSYVNVQGMQANESMRRPSIPASSYLGLANGHFSGKAQISVTLGKEFQLAANFRGEQKGCPDMGASFAT